MGHQRFGGPVRRGVAGVKPAQAVQHPVIGVLAPLRVGGLKHVGQVFAGHQKGAVCVTPSKALPVTAKNLASGVKSWRVVHGPGRGDWRSTSRVFALIPSLFQLR